MNVLGVLSVRGSSVSNQVSRGSRSDPQRPVHAVGGEYADELRAPLDPDHRLVVAQHHGERLLQGGVDVDRGAEVAGG